MVNTSNLVRERLSNASADRRSHQLIKPKPKDARSAWNSLLPASLKIVEE